MLEKIDNELSFDFMYHLNVKSIHKFFNNYKDKDGVGLGKKIHSIFELDNIKSVDVSKENIKFKTYQIFNIHTDDGKVKQIRTSLFSANNQTEKEENPYLRYTLEIFLDLFITRLYYIELVFKGHPFGFVCSTNEDHTSVGLEIIKHYGYVVIDDKCEPFILPEYKDYTQPIIDYFSPNLPHKNSYDHDNTPYLISEVINSGTDNICFLRAYKKMYDDLFLNSSEGLIYKYFINERDGRKSWYK